MNKFISSFKDFNTNNPIHESDGFGTSDFLMRKISDVYHYFFTLDNSDGENPMGYHLIIGKYSEDEVIEGAKNSYCVLNINQISPELIEDIAIDKESIPTPNDNEFRSDSNELSRIMEFTFKCVQDYLTYNPKIVRIFDEIQKNLKFKGKGEYTEYMKSIALANLGSRWSVQQGTDSESIIISR